jgi:PIN domain nuclease of toxin-antitoxin system
VTRYLADTHALWWAAYEPERLGRRAASVLADSPEVFMSVVSIWEVAIKVSLGKLHLRSSVSSLISELRSRDIQVLPVEPAHAIAVADLPLHHRDPFDRLLIAQAKREKMTLLTCDAAFEEYGVKLLW